MTDKHASAMGKKGGAASWKGRRANMTLEERRAHVAKANAARKLAAAKRREEKAALSAAADPAALPAPD